MSEETKEYKIFLLLGGGVLLLEGILICLFSAAGVLVLDDPMPPSLQTPLIGIIVGFGVFCIGLLFLLIVLAQNKGWLKESMDERSVKMAYKATFHAYFIMLFVAFNLIFLDLFTKLILPFTTGIGFVIGSGILTHALSYFIQDQVKVS